MFKRIKKLESLPPTSDSLIQHIKRSNYETAIWKNAHVGHMHLQSPTDSGGKMSDDGELIPILMTLPAIPEACLEIVACKCVKSNCLNFLCKCRKSKMLCTSMCTCSVSCTNADSLR